jgi:hypothetical protein
VLELWSNLSRQVLYSSIFQYHIQNRGFLLDSNFQHMNNSHLCVQITQGTNKFLASLPGNIEGSGLEEIIIDTLDQVE